jgi:hypothetical protein
MKKYFRDLFNKVDCNVKEDTLKFKLSECLNIKIKDESCHDENSETEIKNFSEDLLEDFDLNLEEIETEDKVEQIFDGYLGEKNFDPNPLEYGPNAMYRRNGTVYRKSVDNLWEAYLKDGSPGPRGAAGGSGVGVQEVVRLIEKYGQTPFSMNKKSDGSLEMVSITISAGQYLTSALPIGPSYLFQYTGIGPFTIKTGDENVISTSNDLPTFSGLREILYIKDSHISIYGIGPGTVTIVGGVGI